MNADHTARVGRMGASDAAAALGLSPYRTAWELWAEKTGRLEPASGSEATRMGQRLEATILDVAEAELGPLERNQLVFAPHVDFPLAATLDARIESTGVPVEAKTSGIVGPVYGEWGEPETDVIPAAYLVQAVVQLICTEAEFAHVYALLGSRGIVRYRVLRDEQVAAAITGLLANWWQRHVVEGIEPARTESPPLEVVKRLRRVPEKTIELYADDLATVAEWEQAKALKLSAEKSADAAQAKLLLLLGDAEGANLEDGRQLTYYSSTRKGYSVADSSYRTLRLKKGE